MRNWFQKSGYVKLPQTGREAQHEQYTQEHAGGSICPECHDIHYMKKWHPADSEVVAKLKETVKHHFRQELCPACRMVKSHTYEGELFIENFPQNYYKELTNLIERYTQRATALDPQSRIVDIQHTENGYRITTTENQFAVRLAKKIKNVFNKVDLDISYGSEPQEVSRVHATFRTA